MPQSTAELFQKSLIKTDEILKELELMLGLQRERRQAYHVLREVLHAVRDRLTVNEAADLGAQLPLVLKGVYYDGWSPAHLPMKMNKEEFLYRIQLKTGSAELAQTPEELVKAVLTVLRQHVSSGEIADIKAIWPADLNELFK